KKLTLSIVLLLGFFRLNSQINLEHTYTVNSSSTISTIQLSTSGYKYMITDNSLGQIKLYNTNHSLWKTLTWPIANGFNYYFANLSENLFNLDNQIEFIVYSTTTTSPVQWNTKIYSETGTVIRDFPNRYYNGVYSAGLNNYKLILSDVNTIREVYSLPGTSSNLGVPNNSFSELSGVSFPNPTSQTISIPYQLTSGQTSGQLKIYNSTGVLIESFQVDSNFNDLILDVSSYSNGVYLYKIVSNGIESESKSFVKQ
ncbi:MAG: T9SS C-terminal target domain-containing protein, partial [Crocinitomicaceae bacterium]|nr:T9SS C-terminal target domain-containing protein [Crocinitomicaceae bacterium]NCA22373.1 T9SS C-terminal target domain-containing protein [Crocinitomicaceae bacterium]